VTFLCLPRSCLTPIPSYHHTVIPSCVLTLYRICDFWTLG